MENEIDIVEVDKLTAGSDITTFQVNGFKCGVAICYDANFDEFVKIYGKAGEFLLIRENQNNGCFEAISLHGIYENNNQTDYFIGCDVVFFAAAFHISTGPQYWELVHRARAVDNQLFVAAISPARNEQASYVVYGHSMIIDPIGNILVQAGIKEEIIFYELGLIRKKKLFSSLYEVKFI